MPTFRRLPRATREQDILDAAVAVFSRRGYHDASVDEIAEAAGLSKPMVYAYVGTKEELFSACVRQEGLRLLEALAEAAGRGQSARARLREGLTAFFGFVASHRDGWTVLYRQSRGQDPFADVIASLRARMAELVIGMLSHVATPAADPEDLATLGYAVIGAAEELAEQIATGPGEVHPGRLAERLTRLLWTGASPLLEETTDATPPH
jgi:AcrR family transcriptional regulator